MAIFKKIWKRPSSTAVRRLAPFVSIAAALLLQLVVMQFVPAGYDFPYPFFYLMAILAAAWFGGYWPGIIASLLTLIGIPAIIIGFRLPPIDPMRTILMIGVSVLVSAVASGQQKRREILRQSNDDLDHRVRSRTRELNETVETLKSEVEHREATERKLHSQLERLNLLDQITRAIGARFDLRSLFQVVLGTVEDSMPIDFGCVCLREPAREDLTVSCLGVRGLTIAVSPALVEGDQLPIDHNGLQRCVSGRLVYEPDITSLDAAFPQRLAAGGLRSMVIAPLIVESQVFGVLVAARLETDGFASGECEFLRQLSEHVALAAHQAQTHAALLQAYDDLRKSQQTAMQQERLRALGQMASGIAHDINNAISPVALYTEVLLEQEPNLSTRTRTYLETTRRAVGDVAETVARMREFYRQQEPQLTPEPVELGRMVKQTVDHTRARWSDMAQRRGVAIQVRTELTNDLPPIAGVESEIREALTNLIFNAVDAMPEGGVLTLLTRASATQVNGQPTHEVLEVSDTGIGMSEETRRKCLEPFFTTKGERGTGLGLAMVYGVAQRHSAEIAVESAVGKGTTIRLTFPVPAAMPSAAPAVAKLRPSRLRLLVVDDDPMLIKSLCDALESDGHLVETATGGEDGIRKFESSKGGSTPYAAVITDLGMPYVDGRQVASAVKSASPATPVLMLTGWGERLLAENDIPDHVDRLLKKPPRLSDLRTALAEVTQESAAARR